MSIRRLTAEVTQTSPEWMPPTDIGVAAYALSQGALMLVFSCETEGFMMEVRVDAEQAMPEDPFTDLRVANGATLSHN